MKKNLLILWMAYLVIFSVFAENIDLNTASLKELERLPILKKQAEAIYDYRMYRGHFKTIYDLRNIPEIDQKTMLTLRKHVVISHYKNADPYVERRDELFYLLERLGSNEGLQEGMSDVWEDYLMTTQNVNDLSFRELTNFPNVNAQDAAAIRNRIERNEPIQDYRDLRKVEGISYYAAKNLKNFVHYKEETKDHRLFFDYQFKYQWAPSSDEAVGTAEEMQEENGTTVEFNEPISPKSYESDFHFIHKTRVRYGNKYKAGFLTHKQSFNDNSLNKANDDNRNKYYFQYNEKNKILPGKLNTVLGNYRVSYGEGLVMESTDFRSDRTTGFGFTKRILGITPDISRTQEFKMNGVAVEYDHNMFNFSFFYSDDDKDAIVYDSNNDGEITDQDYVLMHHVSEFYDNRNEDKTIQIKKDYFNEQVYGYHFGLSPFVGTSVGMTLYRSIYNKDLVVVDDIENEIMEGDHVGKRWTMVDNEITSLYSTKTEDYDVDYRQVIGYNWQTVLNNTEFRGEFAELQIKDKDNPHAAIASSYTQFENFNFLVQYRDMDLDFDNPYARSFSESKRFDDTVFEKAVYGMINKNLNQAYSTSFAPSPEKGIYFQTRYKLTKSLTITKAYVDFWERKADGRKNIRFEGTLEYRPLFKYGFRFRMKHQTKRTNDFTSRASSTSDEYTLSNRIYLSARNMLKLEYRYSRTDVPPYTKLTYNADEAGSNYVAANTIFSGDYVGVDYTHNFNENLKVKSGMMFWQGNHWDFEDVEIDFMDEEGMKYWASINSKISSNLYLSMKYKVKDYRTIIKEVRDNYHDMIEYYYKQSKTQQAIRLQLDWKF